MQPLRVALIGAGGMASLYRGLFAKLPGTEWALAVDVLDQNLEACKALGAKRVSKNFDDALKDDVDLLCISTPNHLHEPQAIAGLNAGKHVLLEKPITNTLDGADRLLTAAKKARGVFGMLMTGYTDPMVWEIRRMLDSGALGKIQSIRARDAHTGGLAAKPDAWRGSKEKTGGGSFVQLSIHSINAMQWWLDSRIEEVRAFSARQYCENIGGDDVTVASVRFANGTLGIFESGWASAGRSREIYGTRGYIRITSRGVEVCLDETWSGEIVKYTEKGKPLIVKEPGAELDDPSNPYNQHVMFVKCIQEGKPPHMTGERGRQDLAVTVAAYRSAESGRSERV
ncbi:MAG TPA: Gfo/Idh/MocA family oxidoreductase [Planctomycetota bacterium]|nr:Gfo/Idh/MocA family oxidoreductase [Planctomycetota bacterium]